MPTEVPGANARYQALQSLGESIAKIGRTAADIYLTQAEKEQDEQAKIAIVEYGQFRDQARNAFFRSLEEDPPVDMADAMARTNNSTLVAMKRTLTQTGCTNKRSVF